MAKSKVNPWDFLADYKGKFFQGEWPTLPELFRISTERYPNNRCFTAFAPEKIEFTFTEALAQIELTAANLIEAGIKKGDAVGVTGKNSPEWAIAYFAALFAGAIIVPVDYQLKDNEVEGLFDRAKVKAMFIDSEKYDFFEETAKKKKRPVYSLATDKPNYILNMKKKTLNVKAEAEENDIAAILFTSGTTGVSKGVVLSHQNLSSDCLLAQSQMDILPTDVFYALLPLHHSYSMQAVLIESFSVGAETIFTRSMAVAQILKDLKQGKVTMFLGIPLLFNKLYKGLLNGIREKGIIVYGLVRFMMGISGFIKKVFKVNPGKKMFKGILAKLSLDTNRICICGGGPLPSSTFRGFNQLGIDFVQGYGLTETSPIAALNPIYAYKEASVGKIIDGIEAKILDPDASGIGEILLKGSIIMQGYYEDPKSTEAIMTEDDFLKTGDMGYLDSENYLYLTGRAKNIIVTEGGKNVFPEEIEDKFQLFDEIEQIMIRGYLIDKKMKSEGIEALVYPIQDPAVSPERIDAIIKEANKELLPYQRIQKTTVLEEPLEMTSTKKVKRFKA